MTAHDHRKPEPRSFSPSVILLPGERWQEALDALQRAEARVIAARAAGVGVEEAEMAYEAAETSAQVLFGAGS